ncbi:MAG: outer membrane protein assembly factor BamE [Alphaproteobacteria bacterium]|nr:outer membrane protein assembly factor BamE [Alphaproteobacteria bacterium]TAD91133.1 MAG: outer membrane protein assembly factor BamE [Alphaproteobacteria bacterium]
MRSVALVMVLALGACSPIVDQRGALLEPDRIEAVRPGLHTRAEVQAILGTPTSVSTFDPNIWYYVGRRTETLAWFAPKPTEQQAVMVRFDASGTVTEVVRRGLEDSQQVAMTSRETPTAGHSLTFLEQLFGNVGRFTRNTPGPAPGTLGRVPR